MWGVSFEQAETSLPRWGDPNLEAFFKCEPCRVRGLHFHAHRDLELSTEERWAQSPGHAETEGIFVSPLCLGRGKWHSCSGSVPGADSDDGEVAQAHPGAPRLTFAAARPGWIKEL